MCRNKENKSFIQQERNQNYPRQTYLHISAPTNLQKESLLQEIITSIKQYGKTEKKNIMKNTFAAFLRY